MKVADTSGYRLQVNQFHSPVRHSVLDTNPVGLQLLLTLSQFLNPEGKVVQIQFTGLHGVIEAFQAPVGIIYRPADGVKLAVEEFHLGVQFPVGEFHELGQVLPGQDMLFDMLNNNSLKLLRIKVSIGT